MPEKLEALKEVIRRDVFVTKDQQRIISSRGGESNWLFGAAICNEPFSVKTRRRILEQRTPIFIVTGSDNTFTSDFIFNGTLRIAQLWAAEGKKWFLRAYKTGISAIVAPNGDVITRLDCDQRGILYFDPSGISRHVAEQ